MTIQGVVRDDVFLPLIGVMFNSKEFFPSVEVIKGIVEKDKRIEEHLFFKNKNIAQLVADAFGGKSRRDFSEEDAIEKVVLLAAEGYVLTKSDLDTYINNLMELLFGIEKGG